MVMKNIYLAIPYSGMEESSYRQATVACANIMKKQRDINVFSPITHSHPLTAFGLKGDWDFWRERDFEYINLAEEVWVLIPDEGFNSVLDSVGVQEEISYAKNQGKNVKFVKKELIPGQIIYLILDECEVI
jgi:hypothetical protein